MISSSRHLVPLLLLLTSFSLAQTPAAPPAAPATAQTQPGSTSEMTPDQKTRFAQAGASFGAGRFAEALPVLRQLLQERPADPDVAKFTAETAVNTGDPRLAITILQPFELRDPDDWQTVSILAHAYAQAGRADLRDTELARLQTLHDRLGPPFSNRRDFLLESVTVGDKKVSFFPALTPWGPFHVHLIARVYNAAGEQIFRVTLESPDFDQAAFAREHPDLAARHARRFSLDGYAPDQHDGSGKLIQTHYTYAFFDGLPSYNEVRSRALAVVEGKLKALSSTTATPGGL